MTYKTGQWVKIKDDGRIFKVSRSSKEGYELIDSKGEYLEDFNDSRVYMAMVAEWRLEPAPKTWDTLEVGDIILENDNEQAIVLAIQGDTLLRSRFECFWSADAWYTKIEMKELGYKIKGAVDEVEELTVEEISERLGKTIKVVKK